MAPTDLPENPGQDQFADLLARAIREAGETTELRYDDLLIDRLVQKLYGYRIKPESPHFVSIEKGGFELDGKPWKANGVNYMPSSGVGLDNGDLFEHWIGSAAYDPEIVDRDWPGCGIQCGDPENNQFRGAMACRGQLEAGRGGA